MQRVIDGEIEMVKTIKQSQENDWKDEIVLVLISIPLLVCAYGIFSNRLKCSGADMKLDIVDFRILLDFI